LLDAKFCPGVDPVIEKSGNDRMFIFRDRKILIRKTDGVIPLRSEISSSEEYFSSIHFIGSLGNEGCYTCRLGDTDIPTGYAFEDLRKIYMKSSSEWKPAISTAVMVADWDKNHVHCGRCGAKTELDRGERCRKCPSCGHSVFPRISPAIIVAIIKDGYILLAHNKNFTSPIYSLIAGFVEAGEYLEDTVRREVLEETGLTVSNIRYFASQSWPFPDSLMIGYTADYASGEITVDEELSDAGWFNRKNMPEIPSHGSISRRIIDWFLETGGDGALPGD
jgi:NAD+ diphosphatase